MEKRLLILCAFSLSLSLLAGCAVTPLEDEEFQKDWADSMEEAAQDWAQDWEAAVDDAVRSWSTRDENGAEKDHYWKILDSEGRETGTVADEELVKVLDDLLSDDSSQEGRLTEDPGDGAYSYVYCQQETRKAGQKEEDREYEELMRFTVSASEDTVTMEILENLPSLLNVDLGDLLTFTMAVPAETAEALRDPGRFLE